MSDPHDDEELPESVPVPLTEPEILALSRILLAPPLDLSPYIDEATARSLLEKLHEAAGRT